ncbi:Anti-sigma F factor antagonist (spoIIAA-2); Anti-sigma B factor antagonist RsbV [hydrothermal vent metagenome]|uniref:Anti-sigma F factor antagonist (SpoIIAA-2) Anti-sigma B factor antagonist RsbV n=1 Tax=hydrothermal vent metagenome TaxID=652676 RepID=A0A3B0YLV2_9ZZZZ
MSNVNVSESENGRQTTITITISGRFDFSVHKEFRDAYINHTGRGLSFILDLSRTEYMDSSALGMVLLLRDHAGGDNSHITIRNASADVAKILRIANFDKLLKMSAA